ncbi:MAG: hypothetical protein Fur0022_45560 [Anaerolineales bacterium]
MTLKEMIEAEINSMSNEELQELYGVIQQFAQSKRKKKTQSLMAQLKRIKIDAPEDLAENHDFYITGEQSV